MAVYNEKDKTKWTKDGRHWYFIRNYKDINGKTRNKQSKMYLSQKDAEKAESKFISETTSQERIKFIIIGNSYFEYILKTRKLSTYEAQSYVYAKHILPYFKDKYINNISVYDLNLWKKTILNFSYKASYLNRIRTVLIGIFNYAVSNYGIVNNAILCIKPFENNDNTAKSNKQKLRYITLSDFNTFENSIDDIMWNTFFNFLFYTGMRKGEILALNWNDINFETKEIQVYKTLYCKNSNEVITNTKTGKNRVVIMNNILYNKLIKYKKHVMKYTDYKNNWYVFGNSIYLAPTTIDRKKHEYFIKANLEDKEITIHEFRHSHVSLLFNKYLKSGQTDLAKFYLIMSERMGHSVEVMRRTYMHLAPTIQNEIIDLLDNEEDFT